MAKVLFPNFFMRLMSLNTAKSPAQAILRVPPKMTKHEVKEYLTKIYNVPVIQVNTINYLGAWKRLYTKRRIYSYKRRNYKKAYVTFEKPAQ